jgi:purine nucleoside phosphorylase
VQHGQVGKRWVTAGTLGMGPLLATSRLKQLIRHAQPQAVLLIGFAGGLNPELKAGQVVQVTRLIRPGQPDRTLPLGRPREPGASVVCVDHPVCDVAGKRRLREETAADLVDMESYAVVSVAEAAGLEVRVLRAVSDAAHQALPPGLERWVDTRGRPRRLRAALSLMLKPHRLPATLALAGRTERAAQGLAQRVRTILTAHLSRQGKAPDDATA